MFAGRILINETIILFLRLYSFDPLLCATQAYHHSAMYVLIPGKRKCTENIHECRTKFSQTLQVLIILDYPEGTEFLQTNFNVKFSNRFRLTDYSVEISVKV
jgi:hypothetical protein